MTFAPKFDPTGRALAGLLSSAATLTTLKALGAKERALGLSKVVEADQSRWYFHDTSALTADDILVAAPSSGSGRWLRSVGRAVLRLPFTFATADAAVLLTVPTGCQLRIWELYWEIDADLTGGTASAIGVSSNKTGYTTKGDLLGGAAGDVAAALTTALSPAIGTIGAKRDLDDLRALFVAANTLRFDRITSAFTAGSGSVVVVCDILKHAGA